MEKIVIIGAGDHAKVVADTILAKKEYLNEEIEIAGFLDDKYDESSEMSIFNIPILGSLNKIKDLSTQDISFLIAIGDNKTREEIVKRYSGLNYFTAKHPKAVVGKNVEIGAGSVVMANAVINSYAQIGKHCIINTGSIIEHDVCIKDFVHISPNAALGGRVKIGKGSWIGIGTNIIQGKSVGSNTIIGAGSVVVNNIGNNKKAFGIPCKER